MEINLKHLSAINKYAASTKATRYYLNGVFIHSDEVWVYAVATDGNKLVCHRFKNTEGVEWKFIIPSEIFSSFRFNKRETGAAEMTFSNNIITINHAGISRSVREVDGTFPDYKRIRPENDVELEPGFFLGEYCSDFDKLAKEFETVATINPRGKNPALVSFKGRDDIYGVLSPLPSDKREFSSRAPF